MKSELTRKSLRHLIFKTYKPLSLIYWTFNFPWFLMGVTNKDFNKLKSKMPKFELLCFYNVSVAKFISFDFVTLLFISFLFVLFSFRLFSFRFVSVRFVCFCFSFCFVSLRFIPFRLFSFRFVSFRCVSFRIVAFRFFSFRGLQVTGSYMFIDWHLR